MHHADRAGVRSAASGSGPSPAGCAGGSGWPRPCSATPTCSSSTSRRSGLDPEQRLRFREMVSHAGEGRTVVLSTHQTEDVAALCTRIAVIHQGRARFAGTPAELTAQAAGRVWTDTPPSRRRHSRPGAPATAPTATSATPPAGAELIPPTLEDAYLLLVGEPELEVPHVTAVDSSRSSTGRRRPRRVLPLIGREARRLARHPVLWLPLAIAAASMGYLARDDQLQRRQLVRHHLSHIRGARPHRRDLRGEPGRSSARRVGPRRCWSSPPCPTPNGRSRRASGSRSPSAASVPSPQSPCRSSRRTVHPRRAANRRRAGADPPRSSPAADCSACSPPAGCASPARPW